MRYQRTTSLALLFCLEEKYGANATHSVSPIDLCAASMIHFNCWIAACIAGWARAPLRNQSDARVPASYSQPICMYTLQPSTVDKCKPSKCVPPFGPGVRTKIRSDLGRARTDLQRIKTMRIEILFAVLWVALPACNAYARARSVALRRNRHSEATPSHVFKFSPDYGKSCGKELVQSIVLSHDTGIGGFGHSVRNTVSAQP